MMDCNRTAGPESLPFFVNFKWMPVRIPPHPRLISSSDRRIPSRSRH
jgi:hypothetical protein